MSTKIKLGVKGFLTNNSRKKVLAEYGKKSMANMRKLANEYGFVGKPTKLQLHQFWFDEYNTAVGNMGDKPGKPKVSKRSKAIKSKPKRKKATKPKDVVWSYVIKADAYTAGYVGSRRNLSRLTWTTDKLPIEYTFTSSKKPRGVTKQFCLAESLAMDLINDILDGSNPTPMTSLINEIPVFDWKVKDWEEVRSMTPFGNLSLDNVTEIFTWVNDKVNGSAPKRMFIVKQITATQITRKKLRSLPDLPNFRMGIVSSNLAFRSNFTQFKDRCVPDVLFKHLNKSRGKKPSLEYIIKLLNENKKGIDESGTNGYTCNDLVKILDLYKVPYKIVDINEKVFLEDIKRDTRDSNQKTFVAQQMNNHIHYCEDETYIKSLAKRQVQVKSVVAGHFTNVAKEWDYDHNVIIDKPNLNNYFTTKFKEDKTLRRIALHGSDITRITYDNVTVHSNEDIDIIKELVVKLKLPFQNQNLTTIAKHIWNECYPNHTKSIWSKTAFDNTRANGAIIREFNKTETTRECIADEDFVSIQQRLDINKCRMACLMDNKLGDYPVFGLYDDIQHWTVNSNSNALGRYYILTDNQLPLRGNGWYSLGMLKYADKQCIDYKIKYVQYASSKLPSDYGIKFCEEVQKVCEPKHMKKIINTAIGYLGRRNPRKTTGWLEPCLEAANTEFWKTDNLGSSIDNNNIRLKPSKSGTIIDIDKFNTRAGSPDLWLIRKTTVTPEPQNDLPIYQQILENEWIRIYELRKLMGGNLIKISTDMVIVEHGNNLLPKSGVGGWKNEPGEIYITSLKPMKPQEELELTNLELPDWNETVAVDGDERNYYADFANSIDYNNFLITGLAGSGKTVLANTIIKKMKTAPVQVAFTHKAVEGLKDGMTLHRAFGINVVTGKCSKKKINSFKNVECIIIDECFLIPSGVMIYLNEVREKFPKIRMIFIGDPKQLRPVREEATGWDSTKLFYDMCDGNKIVLTKNMRNDCSDEYKKIFNNTFDADRYYNMDIINTARVHITKTNALRRKINKRFMDTEGNYKLALNVKDHHEKGQDCNLAVGMPVMTVVNDKDAGFINSKIWTIVELSTGNIVIGDGTENIIKLKDEQFMKTCVPCFAYTNHKVQGITITEPYVIHEWGMMTGFGEHYTAFSRTKSNKNVAIC
tara:strand:+ start:2331 stop:5777 length:3447 start_codon:yes stop_codon:yes gene_type:complete